MKEKKYSKGSALACAILFTFSAVMWTITTVLRLDDPYMGTGLQILIVLTLLVTFAACGINWYRYFHYDKKQ